MKILLRLGIVLAAALFVATIASAPASAMPAIVEIPTQSNLLLDLEPGDSIPNVKIFIQNRLGFAPESFFLTFRGVVLDDERTLYDYHFQRYDTLQLHFVAVAPRWIDGKPSFACEKSFDQRFDPEVLGVSWAVVAGRLPDGLHLDGAAGHIYGTPTSAQRFSFTIRASNEGSSAQTTFRGAVVCGLANTGADTAPTALATTVLALAGTGLCIAVRRSRRRGRESSGNLELSTRGGAAR